MKKLMLEMATGFQLVVHGDGSVSQWNGMLKQCEDDFSYTCTYRQFEYSHLYVIRSKDTTVTVCSVVIS